LGGRAVAARRGDSSGSDDDKETTTLQDYPRKQSPAMEDHRTARKALAAAADRKKNAKALDDEAAPRGYRGARDPSRGGSGGGGGVSFDDDVDGFGSSDDEDDDDFVTGDRERELLVMSSAHGTGDDAAGDYDGELEVEGRHVPLRRCTLTHSNAIFRPF